ncbi:hypothetical protein GCM10010505_67730 [Kitasatospora aburaviensis]
MTSLALGPSWLDPTYLISTFGLLGILAIVFAESGLLIGFFLPGDSLLFTTGLLVAGGTYLHQPLWLVCALVVVAAVAGDQVGYLFGRKVGPGGCSGARTPGCSSGRTWRRRPPSSNGTGPRPSCSRASCPSCGPSPRSSPG